MKFLSVFFFLLNKLLLNLFVFWRLNRRLFCFWPADLDMSYSQFWSFKPIFLIFPTSIVSINLKSVKYLKRRKWNPKVDACEGRKHERGKREMALGPGYWQYCSWGWIPAYYLNLIVSIYSFAGRRLLEGSSHTRSASPSKYHGILWCS